MEDHESTSRNREEIPGKAVAGSATAAALSAGGEGPGGRDSSDLPEPEDTGAEMLGLARGDPDGPSEPDVEEPTRDQGWRVPALVGLALLLLVTLVGGVSVWKTREEVAALRAELQTVKEGARRTELLQARSALGRANAELTPLRESLPPELLEDLEKAQGLLNGLSERLRAPR